LKTELLHKNIKHSANKYMVKETTCFDVSPCSTLYLPRFHSLFMQIQCCATVRVQYMMHLHAKSVLCHSKCAIEDASSIKDASSIEDASSILSTLRDHT